MGYKSAEKYCSAVTELFVYPLVFNVLKSTNEIQPKVSDDLMVIKDKFRCNKYITQFLHFFVSKDLN